MNNEWNLKVLYNGLDDENYISDVKKIEDIGKDYEKFVNTINKTPEIEEIETLLKYQENLTVLLNKVEIFIGLNQAVDTENGQYLAESNRLSRITASFSGTNAKASKIIAQIPSLDEYCKKSSFLNEYKFMLSKTIDASKHLFSDKEEELYSKMDMVSGNAWGNLQSFLTSTLKVEMGDETLTLSQVRNLAYDASSEVRKKAYDAELKAYEKIADSVAYSLNNIKLQVNMISRDRGFASPLDQALDASRMSRETLEAMLSVIKKHLPGIRKYFTHKARLLGYEGPLYWYDLFAPLGKDDKKYSLEDTKKVLVDTFENLTPEMSSLMKEAFENEWIDFYPRKGKEGGAFDCGLMVVDESRILTNFDGTFGSVDTLAHELGHAFHDRQVFNNRPLNTGYPMPVAETASTFNETHLNNYFIKNATTKDEKIALLDGLLREQTQCLVDIYSRYLFETSVFEKCEEEFLMKDDLCELMLEAQKSAYGDAILESTLHPYMWACKGHYYSSGLSFYNFPYAFGTLFAAGLYDMYVKEGSEAFIPKYKKMLNATPTVTIEDAGKLMGVDLTKEDFWENSIRMIEKDIKTFVNL